MTGKTGRAAGERAGAGRRSGRRERGSLRREAVVDAAFRLAGEKGASGLTMRGLGQELGADVTLLYRLFRDKDELLLAVCERTIEMILDEIGEVPGDESWKDTLRRIAEATWHVQNRFPVITALTFARTTGGPAEQRLVELQLAAFARSGLDPARTVLFYRAFVDTVLGLCAHSAALFTLDPDTRTKDATTWTRIYARLPQQDHPATRAHSTHLATVDHRAVYDTTVEALLAAAEHAATTQETTPHGSLAHGSPAHGSPAHGSPAHGAATHGAATHEDTPHEAPAHGPAAHDTD